MHNAQVSYITHRFIIVCKFPAILRLEDNHNNFKGIFASKYLGAVPIYHMNSRMGVI